MSSPNPELLQLARHLFEQGCDSKTYYLLALALGVKHHKELETMLQERIVKDANQQYRFTKPSCC